MMRVSRIPLMTHDSVLFLILRCLDVHVISFFVVVSLDFSSAMAALFCVDGNEWTLLQYCRHVRFWRK